MKMKMKMKAAAPKKGPAAPARKAAPYPMAPAKSSPAPMTSDRSITSGMPMMGMRKGAK